MNYKDEVWKDVDSYEGLYQVSSKGRVRSLRYRNSNKTEVLTSGENGRGYLFFNLSKKGKVSKKSIHRLVASAFIDNPDNKETVNHIDGNKHNNSVDNLEWTTLSENHLHAYKKGLMDNRGVNHPQVTITEDVVKSIYLLKDSNLTQKTVAGYYNTSRGIVESIWNKRTWVHLTNKIDKVGL